MLDVLTAENQELRSNGDLLTAVDVIPEKVERLNNKISPIQDDYIEKYCYIAAA